MTVEPSKINLTSLNRVGSLLRDFFIPRPQLQKHLSKLSDDEVAKEKKRVKGFVDTINQIANPKLGGTKTGKFQRSQGNGKP